jgi:tetratricopeptide (TPR) repeat protein
MRRYLTLSLAALIVFAARGIAQPSVAEGFDHFYNLEYDEALAVFRAEVIRNPNSADTRNHVAQTILYREMFRSGALESQLVTGNNAFLRRPNLNVSAADEKEFLDSITRALAIADERLKVNPDDINALYWQGVSYGFRANYYFLVRKAWLDALKDSGAARKAHNRVTELDPTFVDARLIQGAYDYIVGSLNPLYRMLSFIAGYHGDRNRGIEILKLVADTGKLNRTDATVGLCAILRREHRPGETIPYILGLIEQYPRNFLLRLELIQMYGEFGDKDKALAVIADVERLKREGAPGYKQLQEEKIRYARGNLLFWYNDLDQSLEDIKAVTAHADLVDLNTGVYAWLRLGQIYDLKRDRLRAVAAYRKTMAYAPGSDAAKEAEEYSDNRYRR